ncbi:6713_t:CDS:2, partial [Paraglomus occultum]
VALRIPTGIWPLRPMSDAWKQSGGSSFSMRVEGLDSCMLFSSIQLAIISWKTSSTLVVLADYQPRPSSCKYDLRAAHIGQHQPKELVCAFDLVQLEVASQV